MLRSDRLRTPHADDDETELWERLRSEAHERSSTVDAVPGPSSDFADFRDAFDLELPEDLASEPTFVFDANSFDTGRHSLQPAEPAPRRSYVHTPAAESESERLARYEALHAQLGESDAHADTDDDDYDADDDADEDRGNSLQRGFELQQIVSEQFATGRFSRTSELPPFAPLAQTFDEPTTRVSRPSMGYSQNYASQPPAAFGHVPGSSQARARLLRKGMRWIKPAAAVMAALALGGVAGDQLVLQPRRDAARTAALAAQQALLDARADQELAEAAARDEAEQRAANEAALRRADEAAAAAAGQALAAPAKAKHSSADDAREGMSSSERRRQERHERRAAARAAAKAARAEARASSKSESSSRRKRAHRSEAVDHSDDPLFGL